ncbi:MAG: hypothetical protein MPJ78_14740 [Hyphomicrobiaceae bacterium]|nr:hypothetical protein [Hyphomicrobiaceae bacterium]
MRKTKLLGIWVAIAVLASAESIPSLARSQFPIEGSMANTFLEFCSTKKDTVLRKLEPKQKAYLTNERYGSFCNCYGYLLAKGMGKLTSADEIKNGKSTITLEKTRKLEDFVVDWCYKHVKK